MSWVKLDDQFADHPKVIEAGPLAAWLFVCSLTYAGRYLTNGFVPAGQLRKLADVEDPLALAVKLLEVGLWEEAEGGYQIHDYLQYNPSAEDVKHQREENSRRQAEWQMRHRGPNGRFVRDNNAVSDAANNGVSSTVTNDRPVPVPDPDPQPDPEPEEKQGADAPLLPPIPGEMGARTPASRYYFDQFSPPKKRWKNKPQRNMFEDTERDVGFEVMVRAIDWGCLNDVKSVSSICTTARKMAQDGPRKGSGGRPTISTDSPEYRRRYIEGKYADFIEH